MFFDLFNLILITNTKEVCARSYFFYWKLSFCFMFFYESLVFISWMHGVYAGKNIKVITIFEFSFSDLKIV